METTGNHFGIRKAEGKKAGIVCCSNGQSFENKKQLDKLAQTLESLGFRPVFSPYIYTSQSVFSADAKKRARALMDFYLNPEIGYIFDISGGDIANEILPYLDFDNIAQNPKLFFGYSDLTVILNALYTKTGLPGVLYQVKHLVEQRTMQRAFYDTLCGQKSSLFDFPFTFVQGTQMEGIVVGGNIRCFLKLAGTEYFPDLHGKLLLLEAYSGGVPQMVTCLSHLKMLGAFDQINGILLGTFTQMENDGIRPDIITLVKTYAGSLPIVKTPKIGHGADSCGIIIGAYRKFIKQQDAA